MNAHAHRLIFNKARGCLMAVGEVAHSGGGGCSGVRQEKRRSNSNNALAFAEQFKRSLGHGLYEQNLIREQVAQLTSDMVLLVENSVILPDGTTTPSSSVIASEARPSSNSFSNTSIDRVAGLYVKGSAGALLASAGRDLNLKAAAVSNAGTGDSQLSAGNNLNLGTVTTASSQSLNWDANNHLRQSSSQDVGSQIKAGGNLILKADQDLNAKAAQVSAGQALKATAGNSVNITAAQASETFDEARKSTSKGFLSSTTTNTQIKSASTTAQGSSFEGHSVNITAGQDQNIKGSNVLADQSVNLSAGGNVNITAAQNTSTSSHFNQTTKSGLFGGGGLSVTLGKQMQSVDSQGQGSTATGSTVGSTGGNVSITAGQTDTQTGSDVITPGLNSPSGSGNIDITAQKVDIKEARETGSQSTEQKFKQSGLTLAITSPVISALQTTNNQLQAAGNTSSGRMQALAAANAAMNLKQGAGQVQDAMAKGDATGGAGISLSLGASSTQSQQQSNADSAKGSKVNAGGNVTITATGAGKDSDITLQGSNVQAGKTATLKADDQVNIVAAQNTTQESSNSSNKSGSIGVGMQLGARGGQAGITVSASAGKGSGVGNSTTYTNSQVAGNSVNIQSGGDTNLKGAVVKGEQVKAKVGTNPFGSGGNLNIASLQDSSQYKEKSQQLGGSVTFGPAAGGSLNAGQTKIDSGYKSVNEQSAIRAGDGGFQVNVQGKTELIGGQITSTQAAVDQNKNSYEAKQGTTTTDLQNNANFKANNVGVGIGAGAPAPGAALSSSMSGAGFGKDGGSAQSTTTAGISGEAGNTQARTGDKETGIGQIFDKDKVKAEVNAQVAIASEFGKQASKVVGDYAQTKFEEAKANKDQAGIEAWKEGGTNRVALHAVVGGLTGGVSGAVGAATSQAVIDQVGQALKDTNLPTELKQALVLAAGTVVGSATGGSAGAATAFNATSNNYLTHAQLQSKQQQLDACKTDACKKETTSTWDKVSQAANSRVEEKVLQISESTNLKTMEQLSADMNGLAQYKSGLEMQLRSTTDPTQRANLQLQINEADNSMRQVANLGKDTLALMYQQTGNPQYQNAYQALTAATSGNEIAGALVMPGGSGGNINKAVQEAKSGAQQAQTAKINTLADEAKAANGALNKINITPADSSYAAPTHTSTDKFQTHGLSTDQVPASITTQMTKDLQATFGAGAQDKMKELINSGSSVPVPMQATAETKLYKLVANENPYAPGESSPYFVDRAQLQRIQQNPSLANDILGLPSTSQSTGFKVYEVLPKPSTTPTVYQSDVATATNKAGPKAVGNATQTLIPDRSQWTEPKLTNIKVGGQ
ncbi:hypothetical protein B9Z51_00440 [Limnohabitans sp. T6-5]|uniref:hemagglutinin repeat-containing protein n=1 Tax=Limnohabitans sp. T6-5 TaxID=1100724 RepID=UPI000D3D96A4|nr:hemagglutinin repeat-containing protein [Limnohabitans sp. T6-5]PUE10857.1 hypothetical protein B9Z51_00440 [Limnohabitans sp. T6-5]